MSALSGVDQLDQLEQDQSSKSYNREKGLDVGTCAPNMGLGYFREELGTMQDQEELDYV